MLHAVEDILSDNSFLLPSQLASEALKAAKVLHSWCQDPSNKHDLDLFANTLHSMLLKSLTVSAKQFQRRKEKMWGSYHVIRCSEEFLLLWKKFLSTASGEASPILYQNITDRVFRFMIKAAFLVGDARPSSALVPPPLTYKDLNAMRYAAGFVCRNVRKRIKQIRPENVQLILSLEELLDGDEVSDDEKEEERDIAEGSLSSCDWIHLVNRGGLLQVKDDAFEVFLSAEEVVRKFYCKSRAGELAEGRRDEITENVIKDEQVMEDWAWVSVDMDDEIGRVLLKMLVEEWVKIRGFSFAHACLELYKNETKKTLERSKGLRKNLINKSDID